MADDDDASDENNEEMSAIALTQDNITSASSNQSVWREWLTEYANKLTLFARQQTRSYEDAEDILQNALVKLSKKLREGTFIGDQKAWMPFMYTQIRREAIDLGRKNDRRVKREQFSYEDEKVQKGEFETPWFEGDSDQKEMRALLEEKLKELPPKFANVITMKIWGERTFAEIGEVLEISQNTAASRYRYGIEALRKKLSSVKNHVGL